MKSCFWRPFVRLERWCRWIGHPDGPSYKQLLRHFFFCSSGLLLFVYGSIVSFVSIIIAITQSLYELPIPLFWPFLVNSYIGGAMLFIGASFWIVGKHPSRIRCKISEDMENVDAIISDVRSKLHKLTCRKTRAEAFWQIRKLNRIRNMKMTISVLGTTALRTLQVQTYDDDELTALLEGELESLKYYSGEDDPSYIKYEKDISVAIDKWSKGKIAAGSLRRYLIILREEIDEYKHRYGYGEAIIESVVYWSIFSGISLTIIGLSPLFHEPYFQGRLTIVHWAVFGLVGAVIATVNQLNKKETYKIAEDEGTSELKSMIHGGFLGIMTSILLYLSIRAELLSGNIFPEFQGGTKAITAIKDNALSVLWAIAAGFMGSKWLEVFVKRMDGSAQTTQMAS